MNYIVWMVIVLIVIIVVILNLELLRRKTTNRLNQLLYNEDRADIYLLLLQKNKLLKLLFTKSTMLIFELNAYLVLNQEDNLENCFNALDTIYSTKNEKIGANVKLLLYYAQKDNKEMAKKAYDNLIILCQNKLKYAQILNDSSMVYGVYITKENNLLFELKKQAEISLGNTQGFAYFRMAKLNYFQGNITEAQKNLKQAQLSLTNPMWHTIVNRCLEDIDKLKHY